MSRALLIAALFALTCGASAGPAGADIDWTRLEAPAFTATVVEPGPAAAAAGVPSTEPDLGVAVNGSIQTFTATDTRVYFGGSFTRAGRTTGPVAALDAGTGALRAGSPRFDGRVTDAIDDGSGGMFVTGDFDRVNGEPRDGLARLLPSGALDTAWRAAAPIDGKALALAGGRLFVAGRSVSTTRGAGAGESSVVAFDPANGATVGDHRLLAADVHDMLAVGGRLLLAGEFDAVDLEERPWLAAVDPATLRVQDWGPQLDGPVRALAAGSGRVYLLGDFSEVDGSPRNRLAAINATTGSLDPSWQPQVDGGVAAIAAAGGRVYLAGSLGQVSGAQRSGVAAVSSTSGAVDAGFTPEVFGGVSALAVAGTRVAIGGSFGIVNRATFAGLALLDPATGAPVSGIDPGPNRAPALLASAGSTLLVAGDFNAAVTVPRRNLAAVDIATGALAPDWAPATNGAVQSLAVAGVEDEPHVRSTVTRALQQAGYQVLEAANGREAVDVLHRLEGRIDLVLTDVVMPEMSGRELAAHVAACAPGTPMVFTSGYPDGDITRRGLLVADAAFVQKPFTPEAIVRIVHQTLDGHYTGAKAPPVPSR